ncbi:hypothetical protein [Methylobacterium komagatae]
MITLHISPDQLRSVLLSIVTAQDAMRDLRDVAEHHRIFGLGDLHRRLSADEVRTSKALIEVAKILRANEQTEQRQ